MNRKRVAVLITTLISLVVHAGLASHVHGQDSQSYFGFRISGASFWDYGIPRLYKWGYIEDLPEGHSIELDFSQTVHHISGPDVELNYTMPLSLKFELIMAAKYQHFGYGARETISFPWWDRQKSLDAQMHCFSLGSRVGLPRLNGQPYIGVFLGYCLVSGWRMTEHVHVPEVEYDPATYYSFVLADGHGGGIFLDLLAGGVVPISNSLGLFGEAGLRLPVHWNRISLDYQHGFSTQSGDPAAELDTEFRTYGWIVSLGVEIRI